MTDETTPAVKRGRGRPPLEATKERISVRLDADVVKALRDTGERWQTRLNEILRKALNLDKTKEKA